ncbi:MAG: hypothetical protein F4Z07_02350, partial [Dehalococcoidia bacterium]|nr:hypothetical protein [Dehalococcoidia bacterium]
TRANGPFFRDEEGRESSLYWWAMNAGKRSVTCELRLEAGRDLFHQLVAGADAVIETSAPGAAKDIGADPRTLARVNPGAVIVSITNYGQTGPARNLPATDIVGSAMGGHMFLNGSEERGPVRTTVPQAYAQVNFQAAVGAVVALYARGAHGGLGQHVDVSMQESMANAMDNAQQTWDILGINNRGPGSGRMVSGREGPRYIYETADGWVAALGMGGLVGPTSGAMIDWLAETGEAGPLTAPHWRERLEVVQPLEPDEQELLVGIMQKFCRTRRKDDLVREAQARNAGWAPVYSPREIVESDQLDARDYWVQVRHEDIGETFVYPGAPFKLAGTPWRQRGRAPRVGEHSEEVYGDVLGLDPDDIVKLRRTMVI